MIHWGFLILTFIAGFAASYALVYQLVKIACQLTDTSNQITPI